jgi:hypothetical protein
VIVVYTMSLIRRPTEATIQAYRPSAATFSVEWYKPDCALLKSSIPASGRFTEQNDIAPQSPASKSFFITYPEVARTTIRSALVKATRDSVSPFLFTIAERSHATSQSIACCSPLG